MLDFSKWPRFQKDQYAIFDMVDEWATVYLTTREAIVRQLPFAHAWLSSNPQRIPRKNMVRFLNTWMRKADEYGNLKVDKRTNISYKEVQPPDSEVMTGEDIARMKEAIKYK